MAFLAGPTVRATDQASTLAAPFDLSASANALIVAPVVMTSSTIAILRPVRSRRTAKLPIGACNRALRSSSVCGRVSIVRRMPDASSGRPSFSAIGAAISSA
jgi:hypothetical protein